MELVWTYREWAAWWPSTGTDELHRHTLVVPNPLRVTGRDEEDGTVYHPALCIVVRPWWLCREVLRSRAVRDHVRWERGMVRETMRADDDQLEEIEARWKAVEPASPMAWTP